TIRAVGTLVDNNTNTTSNYPIKGFVMADAEAINTSSEYVEGTAAGKWHVVEIGQNLAINLEYLATKTNNPDGTQTVRFGPGTDQQTAAVSFLQFPEPYSHDVTADFDIQGGGITAIAIGLLTPNADFGDAPESYG